LGAGPLTRVGVLRLAIAVREPPHRLGLLSVGLRSGGAPPALKCQDLDR